MRNSSGILLLLILIISATAHLYAQPPIPAPEINAASAILIDAETGRVLYEKDADALIPPASMTKLMTIHTALQFINDGTFSADDIVPISTAADFRNLPPHSSLMFIEEGQKVTLFELLKGLAIPSGNDAGVAVAEYLTGSVEAFVELMNKQARELGMSQTHFDDSSGYSALNLTTAREYALFCRYYIEKNSRYMSELHQVNNFTYPMEHNLSETGQSVHGPITQPNHNILVGRMSGVDGLKTGFIEESGYNFAATAVHHGRRLILVTMGGPGQSSYDGSLRRAIDAAALFNYGFYAWIEMTPQVPGGVTIPVSGGKTDSLRVQFSRASELLIETASIDELEFKTQYRDFDLPVSAGTVVGSWELVCGREEVLQNGVITAAETLERGNIFKRLFE